MTITQDRVESLRTSWFPPGANSRERAILLWRALGSPSLTASAHDERAELLRRVLGARPAEFRARTMPLQARIGRAIDGALSLQAERARTELRATLAAGDRAASARRAAETRALTASLNVAIRRRQTAEDGALIASLGAAAERARKRSLTPVGPIRIPLRLP